MPESIHLTDEAAQNAATILLTQSALEFCATFSEDGTHVVPDRPVEILSSGEKILWSALDDLAHGVLPEPAWHGIDDEGKVALVRAIDEWHSLRVPGLMRLWEAVAQNNPTAKALFGLNGDQR